MDCSGWSDCSEGYCKTTEFSLCPTGSQVSRRTPDVSQEASPVPDQLATERPAALTKIGHMFGSLPAKSHRPRSCPRR
jgi:hypothetical protein